jgi:outer membrane protein assembly factor BamA
MVNNRNKCVSLRLYFDFALKNRAFYIMTFRYLLLAIGLMAFIIANPCLHAQDTAASEQPSSSGINAKPYKPSFYGVPLLFNTPETSWGFGVAGGYSFKINKTDTTQRPSTILTNLDYTLNKQIIIEFGYTLFFKHENYQLRLHNSYKKYPDSFWGIGNSTAESALERYAYNRWDIYPTLQKRIYDRLFLGLRYRYLGMYSVDWQEGGTFAESQFLGHDGGVLSGGGLILSWDSRDFFFNPTKGFYLHLLNLNYRKWLGSEYQLTHLELDGRFYWNVVPKYKHILGLNVFGQFNFGEVPFFHMGTLGGTNIMRGYFSGRFRDNHALSAQLEYRFPIWWRFGAAGFVGLGEVSPALDKFSLKNAKYSVGGGLRFMIDRRERINVRFDVGYAQGSQVQYYVTASESF